MGTGTTYIIEICYNQKRYWFRLKSSNGRIIAHSEMYNTKQAAMRSAERLNKGLVSSKIKDRAR